MMAATKPAPRTRGWESVVRRSASGGGAARGADVVLTGGARGGRSGEQPSPHVPQQRCGRWYPRRIRELGPASSAAEVAWDRLGHGGRNAGLLEGGHVLQQGNGG